MPSLFDPVTIGASHCPNRIVMAPLTRGRADKEGVHGATAIDYYRQRASAGLIISEATGISREGLGWPFAPGLWSNAQVEGWKPVTDAVHAADGRIVAQLWHMGRLVHPDLGGAQPVSASATTGPSRLHTYEGKKDPVEARALSSDEIARVIEDYVRAARNAMRAGFDGVQVHGANGYLIDQFLRANQRDDDYGGSQENRVRFLREVSAAIVGEVGSARTGMRLSPIGAVNGCDDPDPEGLFVTAARALEEVGVSWLEMREPGETSSFVRADHARVSPAMRRVFTGALGLNSDLDAASGQALLDAGLCDFVAYGRPFIANPDLVERYRRGAPLNEPDPGTFYTHGREGYTDYPFLEEVDA